MKNVINESYILFVKFLVLEKIVPIYNEISSIKKDSTNHINRISSMGKDRAYLYIIKR